MSGLAELLDRGAAHYLPYLGEYPNPRTVLMEDGSFLSMARIRGVPHELASASERNASAKLLNSLWRQIADDTLTLGIHLVRFKKKDQLPVPTFSNDFAKRFEQAYRKSVLGELFENVWFLSLIVSPRSLTTRIEPRW
jgi:type IV secretion system protein VirB4